MKSLSIFICINSREIKLELIEHQIEYLESRVGKIKIASRNQPVIGSQLIAIHKAKQSKGRVIIGAHIDTKYHTPGALDNGAGLAVLLNMAEQMKDKVYDYDIEFIPFNGEEYYEASGEIACLNYLKENEQAIKYVMNIDSPCHIGSKSAVSFYNLEELTIEKVKKVLETKEALVEGEPWYAGDHCMFVFQGIPCLVVSSSDLFGGGLEETHTPSDTIDQVDTKLVLQTATEMIQILERLLEE